jgi:hypothetical protein
MGAKTSVVETRRYHNEAWTLDQVSITLYHVTDLDVFRYTHTMKIPVEISYSLNYIF